MSALFTADQHFGHPRIVELARRPFSSVEEQDEILIQNWNSVVTKRDTVYQLGDLTLFPYAAALRVERTELLRAALSRLNGRIIFIEGNHDDYERWPPDVQAMVEWNWRRTMHPKKFGGVPMLLSHRRTGLDQPERMHGTINLHGHHHSHHPTPPPNIDVGVDAWNFTPVHLDQILEHLGKYGWGI